MGIYDRDYYREPRGSFSLAAPRSVVVTIILINLAVYIADFFTPGRYFAGQLEGRWLSDHLAVHVGTLLKPWLWWQLLTYGFAHSPAQFGHILFNMLTLWFLGRDVEDLYGPKEFLRLYLTMIVFAAIAWCGINELRGLPGGTPAYGASGAVVGTVVLFALNFPRRTLLLFFVLPIPAWVLGVFLVGMDLLGAIGEGGAEKVAYSMHLAGAALAFTYFRLRWNFGRLWPRRISWPRLFRWRSTLRLHDPQGPERELSEQVDRILAKISRQGEESLTRKERRLLESASREYQRRRRSEGDED